jgi:putative transcriptional regulator
MELSAQKAEHATHKYLPPTRVIVFDTHAMQSLHGQLLVASARLDDPNFAQCVILLVQHDDNGALGLVVNRPLDLTVKQICSEALEMPCEVEAKVYHGGPCPGPLMVVHMQPASADMQVRDKLYFTTERSKIEHLVEDAGLVGRFFIGYAGWGAGQLEKEIEEGSWLSTTPAVEQIFTTPENNQWSRLMTELTMGRWIDPSRIPDDPSVN